MLQPFQSQPREGEALCSHCPDHVLSFCRRAAGIEGLAEQGPLAFSAKTVRARQFAIHPRETVDGIPVLCRGWAAERVMLGNGRRQILSFILPGDLVSSALVFDATSRNAVEAVTDAHLRLFSRSQFEAMLLKQPKMIYQLSRLWAEEKARIDRLAAALGQCKAEERIARLILGLFDRLSAKAMVRDNVIDFPLRHHHVADATGLTPVHVSKVLTGLRNDGLIEVAQRSITITDMPNLRRLADMLG